MTQDQIIIFITIAIGFGSAIGANEARKRADVASTVMYCTLWLGSILIVGLR